MTLKINKDTNFCDYMNYWLNLIKPSVLESTYIGYTITVNIITTYFAQYNLSVSEISQQDIQNYYQYRIDIDKVSTNTILHHHANIHKAFDTLVKWGIIDKNPADFVEKPRRKDFTPAFYNEIQIAELLELFHNDVLELCIYIASYYGLRRSEIIGLKWNAINFDNKTISIVEKITQAKGENGKSKLIFETTLKTKSSKRTFPLLPIIEEKLINKMRENERNQQLLDNYNHKYDEYVCTKANGEIIKPDYLSSHFRIVLKKSNLPLIRLHDLRHTCASTLLANGVQMKEIQEWLGHSNYNVTANYYSHLEYKSKIRVAETIETAYRIR